MRKTISAFICLFLLTPCAAEVFTVDDDGPADFNNIQAAINAAGWDDVILVSPGTYTGQGNRDIDFLGKTITVRSTDPNDLQIVAATIIDCNGTDADPHRGFYFHNNEDTNSTLDGLSIMNGYAGDGGAIRCDLAGPTIRNCVITRNLASGHGGGISCWRCEGPEIHNCIISSNRADSGGGIQSVYSSATLSNCTFINNMGQAGGGGALLFSGRQEVLSCTFVGNRGAWGGGAIYNIGGVRSIEDCLFSRNSAGGGEGGGAVANYSSDVNLANCIFSENSADGQGGAISNFSDSIVKLVHCSFSGNAAARGRAVGCDSYHEDDPADLVITNSILWDGGDEVHNGNASAISITYSDVQEGWPGEGNIDSNPLFALETDDHLMAGSPCIDGGTNTPTGGLPETDKDGNPRPLDGDGDALPEADMGAYELVLDRPTIAVSKVGFSFVIEPTTSAGILQIRNAGSGSLQWQVTEDCNWLEVSPQKGVSTGEVDEVTLTVHPDGPGPDSGTCIVTVVDENATNSPVRICVSRYLDHIINVPADYDTIQAAIAAAMPFDTVVVAPGRYSGLGNCDLDFWGKAITVCSLDPADPNSVAATIIDCNGTEDDPHRGFFFQGYETRFSVVAGFTITNGFGPKERLEGRSLSVGGAILCRDSSPTIRDCRITHNSAGLGGGICCYSTDLFHPLYCEPNIVHCTFTNNAAYNGGAIGCHRSSPSLSQCTFRENSADDSGGGISNEEGSSPTLYNCVFTGNVARGFRCRGDRGGGGMFNYQGSSPYLYNCTFSGNESWCSGGGIGNSVSWGYGALGSNATLINCTFSENSASWRGGGVSSFSSEVNFAGCRFTRNSAGRGGGGIINAGGMVNLINCIFRENSTVGEGGGMVCGCEAELRDCLFYENSASEYGGGLANWAGDVKLTNCIFKKNSAGQYGGGVGSDQGDANLVNCTFVGNAARDANAVGCDSDDQCCPSSVKVANCIFRDGGNEIWNNDNSAITIAYSNVQGGYEGQGNIDADPCFVEKGYWDVNGVWVDGDYHLLAGSPCIDAGDNNSVPADSYDLDGNGNTAEPIPWDLDGNPRIVDGDNDGNAVVDMGAYEFFMPSLPPIEVEMKLTPRALNPGCKGRWVKAHLVLPEGFVVEDVDVNRPARIEPGGLESERLKVSIGDDGLVKVKASFDRGAFCSAVRNLDSAWVTVTVEGFLTTGQSFYGTGTIEITDKHFKCLAALSSHWLETNCGEPDWCDGVDLDQDGAVNFADFALSNGCCAEIIPQ